MAAPVKLWITEPARMTCLATVEQVRGEWFTVDRALFAPRSTTCRHPQYADQGTMWWDGEKRRLQNVADRDGAVWYRMRGAVPGIGDELNCQIDRDIRDRNNRAHTAMHLAIRALDLAGAGPMAADAEVKGGGHFRLTYARPVTPKVLADAVQRVRSWCDADLPVQAAFATRAEAERFATAQDFQPYDPVPGGDPVPLVRIGEVCVYPCDGTHADRTGRIGPLRIAHAAKGKGGFVIVGQVA